MITSHSSCHLQRPYSLTSGRDTIISPLGLLNLQVSIYFISNTLLPLIFSIDAKGTSTTELDQFVGLYHLEAQIFFRYDRNSSRLTVNVKRLRRGNKETGIFIIYIISYTITFKVILS